MKSFVSACILLWLTPCFALKDLTVGVPYNINRNQALVEFHELLEGALKDAGYKMILTPLNLKSTYEMLIDGDVDAISYDDLSNKKGREKIITTSFPLSHTFAYAFYRKDRNLNEKNLKVYKGAIPNNNHLLAVEAEKKHLKFKTAKNPYHCIQMLIEKEIDYCLTVKEVGKSSIESNPIAKEQLTMATEKFTRIDVYFSMKKSFAKDLPKIEESLKKHLTGDLSKYPLIKENLNTTP